MLLVATFLCFLFHFGQIQAKSDILEMEPIRQAKKSSEVILGPIFTLNQGEIRGKIATTKKGKTYTQFLGIPFAEPPKGERRFKPPVHGHKWSGVLEATKQGPKCLQRLFMSKFPFIAIEGDEDCLRTNVYVPTTEDGNLVSDNLPVFVWIYGGGYIMGSNDINMYGPERLLDAADMIIVIPNYRVGAFGFFSTGDKAASGNYGLLDQSLALEWVRDNIASLGGNPNSVTIAGESAGGASVSFQQISPRSAGLFHRVIAQSSTALASYTIRENPNKYARQLAKNLFCDLPTSEKMVNCLRTKEAKAIVEAGHAAMFPFDTLRIPFVPVVENEEGLFLTEHPSVLFKEGRFSKVPTIVGITRDEGTVFYMAYSSRIQHIDLVFFGINLPFLLRSNTDFDNNLPEVCDAIKQQYYNIDLANKTAVARKNIDLLSDMTISSAAVQTVDLMAEHTPVRMYVFNYVGDAYLSSFSGEPDVAHGAELLYLFNMKSAGPFNVPKNLSPKDEAFSERFVKLWANFITQENPTPSGPVEWTTTLPNDHLHLDINEEFSMVEGYEEERMDFWNKKVPEIVAG